MFKGLIPALAMLLVGNELATADQQTSEEFQLLASELPFLSTVSVVYDRPYRNSFSFNTGFSTTDDSTAKEANPHNRILAQLSERRDGPDELRELLNDASPQIRTLAAIALFCLEDAHVLPDLVPLTEDHALTFQREPPLVCAPVVSKPDPKRQPPRPQTVAEVVNRLFRSYMIPAGYHYGLHHAREPGFAEYWKARRDRSFCATWFGVRLERASGNMHPLPEQRIPRVQRILDEIDMLPAADRTWTLLWLRDNSGVEHLISEAELVRSCRELGRENLMSLLQYKIASDDPDLQPRWNNNTQYHQMVRFVLRHADQLLTEQDADNLLRCEQWQRDYMIRGEGNPLISPLWAIAAAQLEPSKAVDILKVALARFDREYDVRSRSIIVSAIWNAAGETESEFIVDWFYREQPECCTFYHGDSTLIRELDASPADRTLISKIVHDDRFDSTDWQTVEALVRWANRAADSPLVTPDELQSARHPLGQGHFHWQQSRADSDYPEETKQLRAMLKRWRRELRLYLQK